MTLMSGCLHLCTKLGVCDSCDIVEVTVEGVLEGVLDAELLLGGNAGDPGVSGGRLPEWSVF